MRYDQLLFFIAKCGAPSQIINGHALPYTSTVEGAVVTIICHDIELTSLLVKNSTTAILCNHNGQWEPNPYDVCIKMPGISKSSSYIDSIVMAFIVIYRESNCF